MTIRTNPKQKVHEISLAQLSLEEDLQPRRQINIEVVEEYSEAMLAGDIFPPIVVFFDGKCYWVADGFHRARAARKASLPSIRAEVYPGDKEDALLFSAGANAANGMRRSNADKRFQVEKMLGHHQWCHWADSEIARRCRVSPELVRRIRERRSDLPGHDVGVRINSEGMAVRVPRSLPGQSNLFDDEPQPAPKLASEPGPRYQMPQAPLTKQELTDTYVRKVAHAVKKASGGAIQLGMKTPFGTAEIVNDGAIYLFANVFDNTQIYAFLGRGLLMAHHLNRSRVVIVGTFPQSVHALIRSAESLLDGIAFRTPEAVLKDAEG